jgi:hypothetical protein
MSSMKSGRVYSQNVPPSASASATQPSVRPDRPQPEPDRGCAMKGFYCHRSGRTLQDYMPTCEPSSITRLGGNPK